VAFAAAVLAHHQTADPTLGCCVASGHDDDFPWATPRAQTFPITAQAMHPGAIRFLIFVFPASPPLAAVLARRVLSPADSGAWLLRLASPFTAVRQRW
jgi:hypothetical protein